MLPSLATLLYVTLLTFWGLVGLGVAVLLGCAVLLASGQVVDGLARLLAPARRLGPWFDYVAATGVLAGLVGLAVLLN